MDQSQRVDQHSSSWKGGSVIQMERKVFQAELYAILEATKYANKLHKDYTIHTDSLSALQAPNKPFSRNQIVTFL